MDMDKLFDVKPDVKLIAKLSSEDMSPEEIVAFGARATIKKEDVYTLYRQAVEGGKADKIKNRLLDVTIGSGHIDVLDQAVFTFVFRDIPRLTTLFLVSPLYLSHLQQSMRYVQPYGVYLPMELAREKDVTRTVRDSIRLYYEMVEDGVPKEDARFVIPLYTVTNIQTVGNARELTHIYLISKDKGIPPITKMMIEKMITEASHEAPELFIDRKANFNRLRYYPSPNLFASKNKYVRRIIEEYNPNTLTLISYNHPFKVKKKELLKALKENDEKYFAMLRYNTYLFLAKMSLTTFHQAIRQRTWKHNVESIYDSLDRVDYIVPPEISRRRWRKKYIEVIESLYSLYRDLVNRGYNKEVAVGLIPHAHRIYDIMEIDEWNYIGAFPIRRCLRAQWEIRMISADISRYVSRINSNIGKYSLPPCKVFGYCPEKNPCDFADILLKQKPIIESDIESFNSL